MRRRILLVMAAALVVAAAGVGLAVYRGMQPGVPGPENEQLQVLVAVRDIPVGTTAEAAEQAGLFRVVEQDMSELRPGDVLNSEPLRGKAAAVTIPAGQNVNVGQWVEPE